jgi:hypothetical protein
MVAVIVASVVLVVRVITTPTPVWRHGDVAHWERWLGDVCHAAEARPHVNRFDDKLTIYETQWENPDAGAAVTSIDCTLTWRTGEPGPRTLVVLMSNSHGQLPGYLVTETATAVARELTGDVPGIIMDLAAGPPRTATPDRLFIAGGYAQPWQWSMRVVLR